MEAEDPALRGRVERWQWWSSANIAAVDARRNEPPQFGSYVALHRSSRSD